MIEIDFNNDIEKMKILINKCIDEGVQLIGTGYDPLFIQVTDRNAFGENLKEDDITLQANIRCRKFIHDNNLMCMFLKSYVYGDHVISFGVTAGKEFMDPDFDYNSEIPDGES